MFVIVCGTHLFYFLQNENPTKDKSGLTYKTKQHDKPHQGLTVPKKQVGSDVVPGIVVVNQIDHQLPLFVVTFNAPTPRYPGGGYGGGGGYGVGAAPNPQMYGGGYGRARVKKKSKRQYVVGGGGVPQ
jgi:hypothetical protein